MSNTIYSLSELLELANLSFDEVTELKVKSIKGGDESEFVSIPQLTAPTISLSGTTISWSAITNASLYSIYIDGTLGTTTSNTSFDLSTLTLEAGTYEIKIKASGNGFLYSNFSNAVSYVFIDSYLTFSSPNSFTLNVVDNLKYWDGTLEYSTDTTNWTEWLGTSAISSASDGTKNNLYLRGTGNHYITGSNAYTYTGAWVLTGSNISCEGNIENLLDYQTVALGNHPVMADMCYAFMFAYCDSLISAPSLPATTLAEACYLNMFANCISLTVIPSLPATTLATGCYLNMFENCISLTSAPALPATILADSCYQGMFKNCTSLETLPELPAIILTDACYEEMFQNCSNIKISLVRRGAYQTAYRIPTAGTGTMETNSMSYMFSSTGGTFPGTPNINTTYYTSNTVIPAGGNN